MKKPFELFILIGLHIFLAAGALYGGGSLIISPDGSLLGLPGDWLSGTPFHSYLIPGFILFILLGLLPLFTIFGLLRKGNFMFPEALNMYQNKYWSWTYSLYTGIISLVWIITQQLLTSYFVLQPVIAATGLLIIVVTVSPRIQRYFEKENLL